MPLPKLLLLLNVSRAYVLALHPPDAALLSASIVAHGLAPHASVLRAVNGSEVSTAFSKAPLFKEAPSDAPLFE